MWYLFAQPLINRELEEKKCRIFYVFSAVWPRYIFFFWRLMFDFCRWFYQFSRRAVSFDHLFFWSGGEWEQSKNGKIVMSEFFGLLTSFLQFAAHLWSNKQQLIFLNSAVNWFEHTLWLITCPQVQKKCELIKITF